MKMHYSYRFLNVVIRGGEIAIWDKISLHQSHKLFRKKYLPSQNPQQIAEQWIDSYWIECLELSPNDERINIIKSLQRTEGLKVHFIKNVFDVVVQHQKNWKQEIYIRFVLTENLKVGNAAKPNYKIESEDGHQQISFEYAGAEIKFDLKEKLSACFTVGDLKIIWRIY